MRRTCSVFENKSDKTVLFIHPISDISYDYYISKTMKKKMLAMGAIAMVAAIFAASTISADDVAAKRSGQSNAQSAENECSSNAVNSPSQSGSGGGANQDDSGNADCTIMQLQDSDGAAVLIP